MADITTLQELKEYLDERFATKDEFAALRAKTATKEDVANMATKDDIARLGQRLLGSRRISKNHHLETHKQLGGIERDLGSLREPLSKAGDSLHGLA